MKTGISFQNLVRVNFRVIIMIMIMKMMINENEKKSELNKRLFTLCDTLLFFAFITLGFSRYFFLEIV